MNCDAVKERLLDCFGDPELPRELADHIRQCDDCRAEWEKLRALAVQMPPDSDFFLSDAEADRFVVKVAQAISRTEQRGDNEIRNPRIRGGGSPSSGNVTDRSAFSTSGNGTEYIVG